MVSGAFESVTLAGRRFSCKSDDDSEIMLDGSTNEVIVHSDGGFHAKKEKHVGKISGFNIIADEAEDALEYINELQNNAEPFAFTATLTDGTVYSGNVVITDDVVESSGDGTIELTVEGNIQKL